MIDSKRRIAGLLMGIAVVLILGAALVATLNPSPSAESPDLAPALPNLLTASQGTETGLLLLTLDKLKCGTYFLSYPEKCLIDGEYVRRYEYPDRITLIDP